MRHHNTVRKFGRVSKQRDALLRSLARSLVLHEKVMTTEAKAKELRPFVEKLVTKGKNQTLAARRAIIAVIGEKVGKKLFEQIAPKYEKRSGGYTRITKAPPRLSDSSRMAIIEFV